MFTVAFWITSDFSIHLMLFTSELQTPIAFLFVNENIKCTIDSEPPSLWIRYKILGLIRGPLQCLFTNWGKTVIFLFGVKTKLLIDVGTYK